MWWLRLEIYLNVLHVNKQLRGVSDSFSLSRCVHLWCGACSAFKWVMLWCWTDHIRFVATYDDIVHQVWSLCSMPLPSLFPWWWETFETVTGRSEFLKMIIHFWLILRRIKTSFCIFMRQFPPSVSVNVLLRLCHCMGIGWNQTVGDQSRETTHRMKTSIDMQLPKVWLPVKCVHYCVDSVMIIKDFPLNIVRTNNWRPVLTFCVEHTHLLRNIRWGILWLRVDCLLNRWMAFQLTLLPVMTRISPADASWSNTGIFCVGLVQHHRWWSILCMPFIGLQVCNIPWAQSLNTNCHDDRK